MATDYVDAGQAIDNSDLSTIVGRAPAVTKGVTYEVETQPLKAGISATGECGAWNSARVRITSNGKELANVVLQEWCSSSEVVSQISIAGGSMSIVVNRISADKYYAVAP